MKRRQFLAASCLAATASLNSISAAENSSDNQKREYYELRLYHVMPNQKKRLSNFFQNVAIPALNRIGIGPVGVFIVLYGPDSSAIHVLLPYDCLESFATASSRLAADVEYQKAGASYINATMSDPPYIRIESSLMVAFEGMPKLEVPKSRGKRKKGIYELRTYESHSEKAGKKKIEMFNKEEEISIFRKTGLQPVFFGETLIGRKLPNMTYMLTFENMQERNKSWDRFGNSDEWKALSVNPAYKDTVSSITDIILRPVPYSQI